MILPSSSGSPRCPETILFVDDEAVIRQVGETVLRLQGYHVLLAADGLEALEVYRREGSAIDLVILDLTMPRLSGSETLKRLAELDPGIRLLISTGHALAQTPVVGFGRVLGVIHKPYRISELIARTREALDYRRHGQAELRAVRVEQLLPGVAQGG